MKILVIGDTCEDSYIYCTSTRFCPDAPVPVLKPNRKITSLGMAGNVADNLVSLGAEVDIISNSEKITKTRYVHDRTNHMFIRVDEGEDMVQRIKQDVLQNINWEEYDAVIISDYCKGFLEEDDIEFISNRHEYTFLDTKKLLGSFIKNIKYTKINDVEYKKTKHTLTPELEDRLIVTLGSNGARLRNIYFPVTQVDVRDTSGAGDTFMAGLVYFYVESKKVISTAISRANECATQVVQKKGTAKVDKKILNL